MISDKNKIKKDDEISFEIVAKRYNLLQNENRGCYTSFTCSVLVAVFVRLLCILHGLTLITWVTIKYKTEYLQISYVLLVLMLVEGAYVAFLRQGRESKYFSLSIFMYILLCTPPIWVLHSKRHEYVFHYLLVNNTSTDPIDKMNLKITDTPCFSQYDEEIYRTNENIFMAILVLSAWLLPKDDLARDDSYSLMIQNIAMAADAHEMFYSSDTLKILKRQDDIFPLIILGAWTLSLPLFVINTSTESYTDKRFRYVTRRYLEKLFGNFYWKYITSMILMDGPFFMIRIVGIIGYQVIGLQNIFYISKNIIQIVIQISRILGKIYFPDGIDLKEMIIQEKQKSALSSKKKLKR